MLLLRRAELEQRARAERARAERARAEQARLAAVEARLRQIECEGGVPEYDVVLRSVAAQIVASIREVVPNGEAIEHLFAGVETFAADRRARAQSPPLALYYDADYREREIAVEVAVPLATRTEPAARVMVRELDAVDSMACVVHTGSYASIDQASGALYRWIAGQNLRIAGPYREVYLRFGAGGLELALPPAHLSTDADAYITELHVRVARDE
jgi:effector-binding domain-containing protein